MLIFQLISSTTGNFWKHVNTNYLFSHVHVTEPYSSEVHVLVGVTHFDDIMTNRNRPV